MSRRNPEFGRIERGETEDLVTLIGAGAESLCPAGDSILEVIENAEAMV